jgi:O-acetylhomoserine (thiol)-lyase
MADNALTIARHLAGHGAIADLRYPGLPGDRGHAISMTQMINGFGGMMAFDVGGKIEAAKRFVARLEVIHHAVSLGATESLICIPYLTTMLYMPPERRTTFGVKPNTVRLSVGIEPVEAIIDDLDRALGALDHD